MALIVKKFGGSSVANAERVFNVANIIADDYKKGNDVIIEKATEINPENASKRELDMLLTAGEQISIALLSMAVERLGFPVISLLGWQAGFETDSNHGIARIKRINSERLKAELSKKNIIIVAGFQGINKYDDLTTLGRGGSDTSAVAIAAALKADKCQIYTDVDGVYSADPRKVRGARKMEAITYDEMLELATLGAQVLNNRSVEMAKKYNVELEVLSSLENKKGTIVKEKVKMEKTLVRGVAKDINVTSISIIGLKDSPGVAFKIFNKLSQFKVNVDTILQSVGRDNTKDITFTVSKNQEQDAVNAIEALKESLEYKDIFIDNSIAKISIVGAGMESHPGIASKMFEAIYDAGINIRMIATSEIKISVLIDAKYADKAVQAVHDALIIG